MSASMFLPTFAVIAMLGAGVLTDIGVLMIIEHVAMLLAMLAAMLLRPAEYSCGTHAHTELAAEWLHERRRPARGFAAVLVLIFGATMAIGSASNVKPKRSSQSDNKGAGHQADAMSDMATGSALTATTSR
jgi:hypothetical protein